MIARVLLALILASCGHERTTAPDAPLHEFCASKFMQPCPDAGKDAP